MYGQLVEAARSTGGWLSAMELVQPQTHRRPQPAEGDAASGDEANDGARRKRRRRRRNRHGGVRRPGQPQGEQTPQGDAQPAAERPAPQLGPDGQPLRRRRRRRRRGRGGPRPAASGQTDPSSLVMLPGESLSGGDRAEDGSPGA